ncbi:MAG: hypothetical protein K8U03_07890 [Planctomycetia bacterium]|nr:hypothetical protein [Planctomycetia bacterium]
MFPKESFPPDSSKAPTANALPLDVASADDYEVFGLWMNVQLSALVARWKHLAAPNSDTLGENRNRAFGAPHKAK